MTLAAAQTFTANEAAAIEQLESLSNELKPPERSLTLAVGPHISTDSHGDETHPEDIFHCVRIPCTYAD